MVELTKGHLIIISFGFNLLFAFALLIIVAISIKDGANKQTDTSILRGGALMVSARKTDGPQWWSYELMPPIQCEDESDCTKQMCYTYNIMRKDAPYYDPWICFQPKNANVCS
jgi:hypothetical protein